MKHKKLTDLTISAVLLAGIIIVINYFAIQLFWRFDLTQNNLYSLSGYSKQSAKSLPSTVNVKVYFSKNLPPEFGVVRDQVADILAEYASYGSNFRVRFVDPGDGKEAEAAGVPKLRFNDVRKDKLEVSDGYLGIVMSYKGKTEVLPVVQDAATLEYRITSALKKITTEKLDKLAIVNDSDLRISTLENELSKIYEAKEIQMKDLSPKEYSAVLLVSPHRQYSFEDKAKLDAVLNNGGSIIVLADRVEQGQNMVLAENKSNIFAWLESYGLKVDNRAILDSSSGVANFNQGSMSFSLPYPYWPKISNDRFDQSNSLVAKLDGVVLPWCSAVELNSKINNKGEGFFVLAKSTPHASLAEVGASLSPDSLPTSSESVGSYPLAAFLSGELAKKPVQNNLHSRLIVVGDADFVSDEFIAQNSSNLTFAGNLVDSAMQDEELVSIRSKNIDNHTLRDTSENTKRIVRYANVFAMAGLVIILGIVQFFVRRKTKKISF